ncbi:hypothetical protein [Galbibacter pacificus]|uniref:Uncharacterized protein n=1 Tax=Galbibacter pacificus TaxID=2996052 RepID=A0ABT6FW01_9FLAO|nr:hypothetical protein [Galbibacter pacificus]MDG3584123.1 hypothetical protein [Galbibacter pacificus]MDG3587444.1 hypothetical protein [Galbibacter pacificus]
MIEVFTTNIPNQMSGNQIIKSLKMSFSALQIDFDIETPIVNYPCDHSILRVEGATINAQGIISHLNNNGYLCHILEDKICN